MSNRFFDAVKCGLEKVRSKAVAVVAAIALAVLPGVVSADDPVLPTTGVDMAGYVTAAITGLGAIVIVVVGGFFAFRLIKIGMRWVGRLGG